MEYFELGDLEKFITPKLTEEDAKMIGGQLFEGLQVLHGDNLVHRDLNLQTSLLQDVLQTGGLS